MLQKSDITDIFLLSNHFYSTSLIKCLQKSFLNYKSMYTYSFKKPKERIMLQIECRFKYTLFKHNCNKNLTFLFWNVFIKFYNLIVFIVTKTQGTHTQVWIHIYAVFLYIFYCYNSYFLRREILKIGFCCVKPTIQKF